MDDKMLSQNILYVRKLLGMQQDDMANLCQVARSTYSHYERVGCSPGLPFLVRFTEITGKDLKSLCCVDFSDTEDGVEFRQQMVTNIAKIAAKAV